MGLDSFANVVNENPPQVDPCDQDVEPQTYSVYNYDEVPENRSWASALPVKQGLYDPENEKDACGVGFAA